MVGADSDVPDRDRDSDLSEPGLATEGLPFLQRPRLYAL